MSTNTVTVNRKAGGGSATGTSSGSADGTGTAATFTYPGGIAIDSVAWIFVAETNNNLIRKVSPTGVL